MRKIGWVAGAVAVAVAGGFAFTVLDGGRAEAPAPGSCARVERAADESRYQAMECGSDRANVKVAKVVGEEDRCPTGGAPYTTFKTTATLCLIPNFVEGACYQGDRQTGLRRVDCATTHLVRVVKAAAGTVACGDDRQVRYPEPAVTFCLERAAR